MSKQAKETMTTASIESQQKCGIVMPISACDSCTEQHWSEVKVIITDAVESVGFSASLVSDADDVGIIQKRIIQNLYENPVVVCDVSAKNPNVMFELGMRLAFDKPTIIVKDDKTSYSFDTSPIEHLEYPRDLRFAKIVEFKRNLGEKVKATVTRSESDPEYTTFLKHFGKFAVARLETTEVSKEDYIIEELRELRRAVSRRESMTDREIARFYNMERIPIRNEGDSDRRKKLLELAGSLLIKFLKRNQINIKTVNTPELVIMVTNELMSHPEIQHLCESPSEIEEIVHTTVHKFLG